MLTATVTGCLWNCCGFSESKASIPNCCKLPRAFLMSDKKYCERLRTQAPQMVLSVAIRLVLPRGQITGSSGQTNS